jgi:hypothetical protein
MSSPESIFDEVTNKIYCLDPLGSFFQDNLDASAFVAVAEVTTTKSFLRLPDQPIRPAVAISRFRDKA